MIPAYLPSSSLPQLHSHDYLIRLPRAQLKNVVFVHLFTYKNDEVLKDTRVVHVSARTAGSTEWFALLGNVTVSLAWDWLQLNDGALRLAQSVAPRSNLKVIDEQGYDLPEQEALISLWNSIANLAWQDHVEASI